MLHQVKVYNERGISSQLIDVNLNVNIDASIKPGSQIADSVYVRCLRNNIRAFSACTKTKGEVSFSNRKPWRQKGTGRARTGTAASPLWRKGGVLFGPRPGGRLLDFNKTTSKKAWHNLMLSFLNEQAIKCLDFSDQIPFHKTKEIFSLLSSVVPNLSKEPSKSVLFILSNTEVSLARLVANIPQVNIQIWGHLDFLAIAKAKTIFFLKKDLAQLEQLMGDV